MLTTVKSYETGFPWNTSLVNHILPSLLSIRQLSHHPPHPTISMITGARDMTLDSIQATAERHIETALR
jgi:hypothetical protein